MAQGLLLIDVLNLTHANNANKPLHVGELPTQAIYGVLRSLRFAVSQFPQLKPICLHDGRSWRHDAFDGYKASRNKPAVTAAEKKQADARAQVKPQLPYIRKAFSLLGVTQIDALNMEADDLAALMVRRAAGRTGTLLLTADRDWAQLISPTVTWFDPIHDVRLTNSTLSKRLGWCPEKKKIVASPKDRDDLMGVPSPRAILEIKCLAGDKSDDITGVGGIGDKGALELIHQYGSVTDFFNRTIEEPKMELPKKLRDFADSTEKQEIYRRNLRLMDLNHASIPPPQDLRVNHGALNPGAFEEFCSELLFSSITRDLEGWLRPFRRGEGA